MNRSVVALCLLQASACTFLSRPDPSAETQCSDLLDNDGNGFFDCEDPACVASPECVVEDLPPIAVDDEATTNEDSPVPLQIAILLETDSDPEGLALSMTDVFNEINGTAEIAGATVIFTPDLNFNGNASFDYTVSDPGGNTDTATVSITVEPVNDAPTTVNESFTIDEDDGLNIPPQDLLANDFDVDGDEISFVDVGVGINGDPFIKGNIGFFPDFNFFGAASFEYIIVDEFGEPATGLVNVTVNPVNDAPVALDDTIDIDQEDTIDIDVSELLLNDTDVDPNTTLTIISVQNDQNCASSLNGDTITIAAAPEFNGLASFEYTISDGALEVSALVVVTVLPAECGNNILQSGEQCDDGNTTANDGCNAVCLVETCGDGAINGVEQCDDGNQINNDECSNACLLPACGDSIVQVGETCDDGNNTANDGCNAVCALEVCGDGITNNGEACDDGNTTNGDGCDEVCVVEVCGDGAVNNNNAEQCDDGDAINNDECSNACLLPACGDGILQPSLSEQCDDGNIVAGDGCDVICNLEIPASCGNGTLDAGEQCDDTNNLSGDGCNAACIVEVCGDGLINNAGAETCDDGNNTANDGCNAVCALEVCGDGITNNGEACDDGNTIAGDGCRSQCDGLEVCGDALVDVLAGEQCDDGNNNNFDGCSNACLLDEFVSVPTQIISGGLTCSTSQSNTGRKISSDALGNFYVVMNCGGEAFVVSSTDRGQTYSAPLTTGITGVSEVAIEGGPANVAYVAAIAGGSLVFTRTIDGGLSWQTPAVISSAGDTEVSIDSFGDDVFISISLGQMQIFRNNNRGIGAFSLTALDQANVFHEVIVDKTSGDIISATDTPDYHVRRSVDGALTFAAELNPPGQAFFSDWAGSNGFIYVVGTGSGLFDTDVDVIPFSNLGSSIQAPGLPAVTNNSQGRAIDADPIGNAYVSSSIDGGGIQLDRLLLDASSVNNRDARLISPSGNFGGVAAIPSNNGAVIVYTDGTDVFAALTVYSVCGDGSITGDETCEDGNTNDGDGCDQNCINEVCGNGLLQINEECDDGNLTNGDGCDALCVVEFCGDNLTNNGEECDDGNLTNGDGCDATCTAEVCGNGLLQANEECDDAGIASGDGCDQNCNEELGFDCVGAPSFCFAVCGDGITLAGEQCDDGNLTNGDGCNTSCVLEFCGDGIINDAGAEECDDGNNTSGDGCNAVCIAEFCGDGITNASAQPPTSVEFIWLATSCNGGPQDINFAFNGTVVLTTVGDPGTCSCVPGIRSQTISDPQSLNLLQNGDNNFFVSFSNGLGNVHLSWAVAIVNNGASSQEVVIFDSAGGNDAQNRNPDLCASTFLTDASIANALPLNLATPEECDDGNAINGDGCENNCTISPICGDGVTEEPEECDDGNANGGDGCNSFCVLEFCGDGITNNAGAEECDDGNAINGDGCENNCTNSPVCGDGVTEGAEDCDDGNLANNDGCSAQCQFELVAIDFEINTLTANNCQAIEHNTITGDDRGGIALSANRVLYTGDSTTGSFDINNLNSNNTMGRQDALASDLFSGKVFSLGNGGTPIPFGGGIISSLLEIDPINGSILNQINLSRSINSVSGFNIGSQQTGIFSGFGRITLLATPDNGTTFRVFDINTQNGAVVDLGPIAPIVRQGCENWAIWGVAEFINGELFLTYTNEIFPATEIRRTRVSDGFTEVVATFAGSGLSDMCSFTVAPSLNRWYFHFEGTAVFRSGDETIGFCDANFIF